MFNHVVSADPIDIHAPAEAVWSILVDVEKYGEWNPFSTRVDTTLEVGSPVDLYVDMGLFKIKQPELIQAVEPPEMLAWGMTMGARFLLFTRREQRLEVLGESSCRYHTNDAFNGLLAPLIVGLLGRIIRRGFNDVARALKARAEGTDQ